MHTRHGHNYFLTTSNVVIYEIDNNHETYIDYEKEVVLLWR